MAPMSLSRLVAIALLFATPVLLAQRHGGRAAPPTAPYVPPPAPVVPISTGLGAIQFVQVNFGVPAPQALTRQLRFDDDRTRAAALSAIGAPGQYLQHGHIPMPHSVELNLVPIGATDDLDALLTVELDQHLVTAVLIPVDGNWRRIATFIYATPFDDTSNTPTTWIHTARSMMQKDRYNAIFHAASGPASGNFTENEAHLRIVNDKPIITISFESAARECIASTTTASSAITPTKSTSRAATGVTAAKPPAKGGCTITHRWFQPDPADPTKRFELVTGVGHITPKEAEDPMANAPAMLVSQLRSFTCQPYVYSETNQHYEPTAPNGPCSVAK
jgi:hypothetical protein